jgi:hypothetical protein
MLADAATGVAARMMVLRSLVESPNRPFAKQAAMGKLFTYQRPATGSGDTINYEMVCVNTQSKGYIMMPA